MGYLNLEAEHEFKFNPLVYFLEGCIMCLFFKIYSPVSSQERAHVHHCPGEPSRGLSCWTVRFVRCSKHCWLPWSNSSSRQDSALGGFCYDKLDRSVWQQDWQSKFSRNKQTYGSNLSSVDHSPKRKASLCFVRRKESVLLWGRRNSAKTKHSPRRECHHR